MSVDLIIFFFFSLFLWLGLEDWVVFLEFIKEVMSEVDYEDEGLDVCRTNTFVSMDV